MVSSVSCECTVMRTSAAKNIAVNIVNLERKEKQMKQECFERAPFAGRGCSTPGTGSGAAPAHPARTWERQPRSARCSRKRRVRLGRASQPGDFIQLGERGGNNQSMEFKTPQRSRQRHRFGTERWLFVGDTPTCRGPGHGAASASRSYLRDRAGAGRCCPAPLLPRCAAGGTAPPLLPGAVRTLLRFPAVSVLCGRRSLAFLPPRCRPSVRARCAAGGRRCLSVPGGRRSAAAVGARPVPAPG